MMQREYIVHEARQGSHFISKGLLLQQKRFFFWFSSIIESSDTEGNNWEIPIRTLGNGHNNIEFRTVNNKIEVQLAECKVRGVTDQSLQKESSH